MAPGRSFLRRFARRHAQRTFLSTSRSIPPRGFSREPFSAGAACCGLLLSAGAACCGLVLSTGAACGLAFSGGAACCG
ncbi:MAG: hypothetical protein WBA34_01165, partial [Candidatus Deferrimicrobiaceae bacterium]